MLCRNASDFGVCNWFVSDQDSDFCLSCTLNHTIPNLLEPDRRRWWKSLEQAKRRLIYSLLSLQLPVVSKGDARDGLAFKFIEDQRTNPLVREEFVSTGHNDGLITINIAEADHVRRSSLGSIPGNCIGLCSGTFDMKPAITTSIAWSKIPVL